MQKAYLPHRLAIFLEKKAVNAFSSAKEVWLIKSQSREMFSAALRLGTVEFALSGMKRLHRKSPVFQDFFYSKTILLEYKHVMRQEQFTNKINHSIYPNLKKTIHVSSMMKKFCLMGTWSSVLLVVSALFLSKPKEAMVHLDLFFQSYLSNAGCQPDTVPSLSSLFSLVIWAIPFLVVVAPLFLFLLSVENAVTRNTEIIANK